MLLWDLSPTFETTFPLFGGTCTEGEALPSRRTFNLSLNLSSLVGVFLLSITSTSALVMISIRLIHVHFSIPLYWVILLSGRARGGAGAAEGLQTVEEGFVYFVWHLYPRLFERSSNSEDP